MDEEWGDLSAMERTAGGFGSFHPELPSARSSRLRDGGGVVVDRGRLLLNRPLHLLLLW